MQSEGRRQTVPMKMAFACPTSEGKFYRYCYVSDDGGREKELLPGEWLDDQIVPGSVRCDRFETATTPVANARRRTCAALLGTEGFELRKHAEAPTVPEFWRQEAYEMWLQRDLLPKVTELVHRAAEESFGPVAAVHVLDYTLRTTDGSGIDAKNVVMEPHADFTRESGKRRVQSETIIFRLGEQRPIQAEDSVLLINAWQPLVPTVRRAPLAVCDIRSLSDEDLVRKTMFFKGRIGEVYNVKQNGAQQWWYYPSMTTSEALLFVSWSPEGRTTPHSAVEDPTDPDDAPPRRSMEVRCVVKLAQPNKSLASFLKMRFRGRSLVTWKALVFCFLALAVFLRLWAQLSEATPLVSAQHSRPQ